jgi:hypothetical protein
MGFTAFRNVETPLRKVEHLKKPGLANETGLHFAPQRDKPLQKGFDKKSRGEVT